MRGTWLALTTALAVCAAATAHAHGPVRQKTDQAVEVNVAAAKV